MYQAVLVQHGKVLTDAESFRQRGLARSGRPPTRTARRSIRHSGPYLREGAPCPRTILAAGRETRVAWMPRRCRLRHLGLRSPFTNVILRLSPNPLEDA